METINVIVKPGNLPKGTAEIIERFYLNELEKFKVELSRRNCWVRVCFDMENKEERIVRIEFSENVPHELRRKMNKDIPDYCPI